MSEQHRRTLRDEYLDRYRSYDDVQELRVRDGFLLHPVLEVGQAAIKFGIGIS